MFLVFVNCIIPLVWSCSPTGTGSKTSSATLAFTVNPPIPWVARTTPLTTPDQALANMKKDIESAVQKTLSDLKVDYTKNRPSYSFASKPVSVRDVSTACQPTNPNPKEVHLVSYLETVYYICVYDSKNAKPKKNKYNVTNSVTIRLGQPIFESQWKQLAVLVQDKLESDKKVVFVKPLTYKS